MATSSKFKLPAAHADVLIVGGGPGGSATAIQCAKVGLNVILLEGATFPRAHPGETLHPGVEPLLKQLGVLEEVQSAGFLRHEGNWVSWDAPMCFANFGADEHGCWLGYQAWRAEFDRILLNQARRLGVRILQPCRAKRLLVNGTRVCGVDTDHGELTSTFVVDAAGDRHWLARRLGLDILRRSPCLIAHYGYVTGECPERDEAPAIVADSDGWSWTAAVKPNLYQWTCLSVRGDVSKPSQRRPPVEFKHLTPNGRTRAADVTWRAVAHPAGHGYFLVGDAAAVLDPASSHGVLKAIMTGLMAAHSIRQILWRTDESSVVKAYGRWVHEGFERDVAKLKSLYSIFQPSATDVE